MTTRTHLAYICFFFAITAAGCTAVGPDYKAPETAMPAAFVGAVEPGLALAPAETVWWRHFNDRTLDMLIERAIKANHDVRVASARLREARALFQETDYDRFPRGGVEAVAVERRLAVAQAPGLPRQLRDNPLYTAGFDASWEVDLFGRVQRSIEAAIADAERAEASLRDVHVSVIAEVARNYFELRGLERQLAVARGNAENERGIVSLVESKLNLGRGTELDTSRARAQLHSTLSSIPPLVGAIGRVQLRLAVLTGERPGIFKVALQDPRLPIVIPPIAIGDPAELLRRRPDIRAAERGLASATARIGIATADLFPKISFVGFIGTIASSGSTFAASGSEAYTVGASIAWPVLDLGRVRERIRGTEARSEAALAIYEQAVLRALEETEGALKSFGRQQERLFALREAERESSRAAELARRRFDFGVSDFLTVLDAERTMNNARDSVALNETQLYTTMIAVYKALGGGWQDSEEGALGAK